MGEGYITMGTEQCSVHTANMERIAALETQGLYTAEKLENITEMISRLFEKSEEQMSTLNEVNLCVKSTSVRLDQLDSAFKNRSAYGDKIVDHYEGIVVEFKSRLDELDKFAWFRDAMNKINQGSLGMMLKIFVFVLAVLALTHSGSIIKAIKDFFIK